MGGRTDNSNIGATWVYTRSGTVWSQQGDKLLANDAVGSAFQGSSVSLSADGNTAAVGGPTDNPNAVGAVGAGWIYVRNSGGVWTQQGGKLIGGGAVGLAFQGNSIALSGAGSTAFMGGPADDTKTGAAWVFTRNGVVWSQQGAKLVGSGAIGAAGQGVSTALSADGNTAIVGGLFDNSSVGAVWVYVQSSLVVSPTTDILASGTQGEAFSPASFQYQLASTNGNVNYTISATPPAPWLNASFPSGTATTSPVTVTFSLINPGSRSPGTYTTTITFTNTSNGRTTTRTATLIVKAGTKDGCKGEGWKNYISFPGPFKNQGQCVAYFAKQQ